MRKLLRKTCRIILCALLVFNGFADFGRTVFAASDATETDIPGSVFSMKGRAYYQNGANAGFDYYNGMHLFRIKGDDGIVRDAFCVQPENFREPSAYYAEKPDRFSRNEKLYLSKIVYYAYDVTPKTLADYAKCQLLIWDVIGNEIHFSTHDYYFNEDTHYQSVEFEATVNGEDFGIASEAYLSYKQKIMRLVNGMPELSEQDVTLKPGETAEITDANSLIGDFELWSNDTGTVIEVAENKVRITADHSSTDGTVVFRRTSPDYDANQGAVIVYENATGQDKATFKLTDSTEIRIQVQITYISSAKILKVDPEGKPVKGAVLQLFDTDDPATPLDEWTTDGNPHNIAEMKCLHTYILREKKAPEGYVKSKDQTFVSGENGKTVKVEMCDGVFEVWKVDDNDHPVSGAKLQVLKGTKVLEEWISGNEPHIVSGLTEGEKYILHEVSAPEGMMLANDQEFTASNGRIRITAVNTSLSVRKTDDEGKAVTGSVLAVYDTKGNLIDRWKTDSSGSHAVIGLTEGKKYVLKEEIAPFGYEKAEDISFTASKKKTLIEMKDERKMIHFKVLKKDANDSGRNLPEAEFTVFRHRDNEPVLTVKTNSEGEASGTLPYEPEGYYLNETKAPDGYLNDGGKKISEIIPDETYTFSENDAKFVFQYEDRPENMLRIVKTDSLTGKPVIRSGAVFRIEYLKGINPSAEEEYEELGIYETDQTGEILIPGPWKSGKYRLCETAAPEGYLRITDPIVFFIGNPEQHEPEEGCVIPESITENGVTVYLLNVKNDPVSGELTVHKFLKDADFDYSLIDHGNYAGMEFTLYAASEICDPADGEVLYEPDDVYGTWHPDEEGNLTVKEIPAGEYRLKETSCPDGYILHPVSYPVIIRTDQNKPQVFEFNVVNVTTKTVLSKTSVSGSEEIEGATLCITDRFGNTVEEWVSGKTPHIIEGLTNGETYVLREVLAPAGYYPAEEVTFTVQGEMTYVYMKDAPVRVEILKIDDSGQPVKGAEICLYDITGEQEITVEGFPKVTDEKPLLLECVLIAGHRYRLREIRTPEGYYPAEDAEFSVPAALEDTDIIQVRMTDQKVSQFVRKVDENGTPVEGAGLALIQINENGDEETLLEFESDASEKGTDISSYVVGNREYILRETKTPYGYKTSEDVKFTASGTKDAPQEIRLCNVRKRIRVRIEKYDADNPALRLKGAQFEVYDVKTGLRAKTVEGTEAVGESDENGVFETVLFDLENRYAVREIKAPLGYQKDNKTHLITSDMIVRDQEGGTVVIRVMNVPHSPVITSAVEFPWVWILMAAVSAAIAAVLCMKRRLKNCG